MKRFVVLKDRRGDSDFCVVEVECDAYELKHHHETVRITFFNGKSRMIKKDWVCKTKKEAIQTSHELAIIKNFKRKNKTKNKWVCQSCGRHVEKAFITVDHIKPIHTFKHKGKYISKHHWKKCWSESNLTLMCEECNFNKSGMSVQKHLVLNKKSTFHKLNTFKKKNPKFRRCSMELARRDSRILDKNTILMQRSKLWDIIGEVNKQ